MDNTMKDVEILSTVENDFHILTFRIGNNVSHVAFEDGMAMVRCMKQLSVYEKLKQTLD